MKAVRVAVEVRDPQALPRRIGVREASAEESARRAKPIKLERQIGTLITHGRKLGGQRTRFEQNRIRCGY
jgi:hypothetical protein